MGGKEIRLPQPPNSFSVEFVPAAKGPPSRPGELQTAFAGHSASRPLQTEAGSQPANGPSASASFALLGGNQEINRSKPAGWYGGSLERPQSFS